MRTSACFSFKRFFNYFKYDVAINYKWYLIFGTGLFIALLFVAFVYFADARTINTNEYASMFFLTFVPVAVLITGNSFPALRNRNASLNYLLIPASIFEKVLVQWILKVLFFFVFFTVVFWIDMKISKLLVTTFDQHQREIADYRLFDFLSDIDYIFDKIFVVCIAFSVASFLFAGSVFFKRFAVFKSLVVFGILVGVTFLFLILFTNIFYGQQRTLLEIDIDNYIVFGNTYNVQLWFYSIAILSNLFLLPLAYYLLKEKEV